MNKLDERTIAQSYVGKNVDNEKLLTIFRHNGKHRIYSITVSEPYDMYIAYCPNFNKEKCEQFGITDILHRQWGYSGIDFRVNVYTEDERIMDCKIFKYKSTYCGGHGRPSGYELSPTQQEIRIFRRIMDYITL